MGFGLAGLLGTALSLALGALGTATGTVPGVGSGPATGGVPASQGGSVPHTDSLYSTIGNGRVDTLSYRLRLSWAPASRTLTSYVVPAASRGARTVSRSPSWVKLLDSARPLLDRRVRDLTPRG